MYKLTITAINNNVNVSAIFKKIRETRKNRKMHL